MSVQKQVTIIFLSNHGQEPNVYPTLRFHQEIAEKVPDTLILNQFGFFGDPLALGPRVLVFLNIPPSDARKEYLQSGDWESAVSMFFWQRTIDDICDAIAKVLVPKPRRNIATRKPHPRAKGAD